MKNLIILAVFVTALFGCSIIQDAQSAFLENGFYDAYQAKTKGYSLYEDKIIDQPERDIVRYEWNFEKARISDNKTVIFLLSNNEEKRYKAGETVPIIINSNRNGVLLQGTQFLTIDVVNTKNFIFKKEFKGKITYKRKTHDVYNYEYYYFKLN